MPVDPAHADLAEQFSHALHNLGVVTPQSVIGLAVSGGGDSIAMMHMAARAVDPKRLRAVSVDHGLRPEAQAEIALVAAQAQELGIAHTALGWDWDRKGNLQGAARQGRWMAMHEWAGLAGVDALLMGHTEDDQLETLLMRLARGSGIDGLTAMARVDLRDGLRVGRPLLGMSRAALRDWLRAEQIDWCDDPSNDDPRYDRVRARKMYAQLETLGLTRKRLLQTIDHMQAAQRSLRRAARDFARLHVRQDAGDLIFDPVALDLNKDDAPRRVMAAAISWVASRTYRPRFESLIARVDQLRKGQKVTLAGCVMLPLPGGGARIIREAAATRPYTRPDNLDIAATGLRWDQRWHLDGPVRNGLRVQALGDGLRDCPDWRQSGMPQVSLLASPSVWAGDTLIAAPLAGLSNGWSAQIVADFHSGPFGIED
jgi:tRNA(Ile)-lysidine synthase